MDKIREAFEKWYGGDHDDSTSNIAQQLKDARWEAWQAAHTEQQKLLNGAQREMQYFCDTMQTRPESIEAVMEKLNHINAHMLIMLDKLKQAREK